MEVTTKNDYSTIRDDIDTIYDREWIKSTFLLSDIQLGGESEYKKWIKRNRYRSSADFKFTATTPGMSMAVNPKPQFTRYADIRSKGRVNLRDERISINTVPSGYGLGLGRYYSEAIDDSAQRIFLRFGVPNFTPLAFWIHQAFDIDRAIFANRGGLSSTILQAIDFVSATFVFLAFPLISIGAFVLQALVSEARFYTVKPTMYLYWATVEDIVNSLVARRTMLPHILPNFVRAAHNRIGQSQTIDAAFVERLNELIPDIIDSKGRISIFGLALKAQATFNRIQYQQYEQNLVINPGADMSNFPIRDQDVSIARPAGTDRTESTPDGETRFFLQYIFSSAVSILGLREELSSQTTQDSISHRNLIEYNELYTQPDGQPLNINLDPNNPNDTVEGRVIENFENNLSRWDSFRNYFLAEFSDGAAFAVFNVENTGSVGESFSNSFTSNPIETTFNSITTKVRSITSVVGGATDMPVIGDAVKLALDAGAIMLSNATFGIANPLLALLYGLNVEVPRIWENSTASLPRGNYKIKLISPYGNPYSQLFNIYVPLAMILAGSLPRSTGASSHTAPFLCQLFDRGRVTTSLGMIDSVSITRGTSNLAFNRTGQPNAIDVDFSIANLDETLAVDVASGGIISNEIRNLRELSMVTPFKEYLNTVTGLDVYQQTNRLSRLRLQLAERMLSLNKIFEPDPAAFGAFMVSKIPFQSYHLRALFTNNVRAVMDLTQGI